VRSKSKLHSSAAPLENHSRLTAPSPHRLPHQPQSTICAKLCAQLCCSQACTFATHRPAPPTYLPLAQGTQSNHPPNTKHQHPPITQLNPDGQRAGKTKDSRAFFATALYFALFAFFA